MEEKKIYDRDFFFKNFFSSFLFFLFSSVRKDIFYERGESYGIKKISVATFLRTSNKHLNKNKSQNCYLVGLFQYLAMRNDKRNRYV